MKTQESPNPQERKLKFAEAGVLFVLILALTIFVGARLAGRGGGGNDVVAIQAAETAAPVGVDQATDAVTVASAVHPAEIAATTAGESVPAAAAPREVTYALAEETFQAGRYAEAADLFTRYTDEHQDNAWGFYMLGLSAWKAGDTDEADEAFQAALSLAPDHVKSRINRGRVLLALGRSDDARVELDRALELEPGNLDARRVMGRIQHNQGQLDEAAASYLSVLVERADDVWSLNNLGLIRLEQERFAEALPVLAKASLLRPDVAVIQNNLGLALERTDHAGAAVRAYETALEADADHDKAAVSLARVEALLGADAGIDLDLAAVAGGFDAGATLAGLTTVAADSVRVAVPVEFATPTAELAVAASLPGTEAAAGSDDPDLP